ncbi:methyl-accepting chemotaxis protein [Thiomonas sp.]|jgi:methyl-accepting chemotaxis protein|uniref:methyl-accepting chemotaxis protein n=1 Tax=Thiomonas sp. TaxID=2047785 RepID=UPI00261446C0|nr:methyl-accepting chemotaxis protein [Thiomonas sp.]
MQDAATSVPTAAGAAVSASSPTARALELLAQHVQGARAQMDTAVLDLSQRFAQLHASFEKSMRASDAAASAQAGSGVTEAFAQSRAQLGDVVENLRVALQRRDEAARQAQGVTTHASALHGLVERVTALAAKTDLLALNATIEAARAGEHGRGFSIVAEEVRKLSAQTRLTSQDMAERVTAIGNEMRAMAQAALRSTEEEKQTFADTDQAVQGVLGRLHELAAEQGRAAATLRAEGEQAQQEVSRVMVALQFGDRVSQILDHAARALQDLSEEFATSTTTPDGEAMLARLAVGYTTQEQRLAHQGAQNDAQSGGDDEITFF